MMENINIYIYIYIYTHIGLLFSEGSILRRNKLVLDKLMTRENPDK